MQSVAPVVVATDFSDSAERAARRGALIAKELEADLHLLHVLQPLDIYPAADPSADFRLTHEHALHKAVKTRLDTLAASLHKAFAVHAVAVSRIGRAHKEIADYASARASSLVVTGARGENTLLELLLGSTTSRLLRLATFPVLIARNKEVKPYQRVIAAVDFSSGSSNVLEHSCAIASKARIEALHVYDTDHDDRMRQSGMNETFILKRQEDILKNAANHLDIELAKPSCGNVTRHVVAAYPAAAICERAKTLQADLIVLGRYGKSGLQELLLGSVSKDVVNAANCDVLLCY